jgi:hypothetical protein
MAAFSIGDERLSIRWANRSRAFAVHFYALQDFHPGGRRMSESSVSVTATLAEHCRSIRFDTLPGEATFAARQCLLDWLGVTLGG